MLRYGMGLIVVTGPLLLPRRCIPGLSSKMTVDLQKVIPEFSDDERGRNVDGVMRISDAPVIEMAAPGIRRPFAGGGPDAGAAQRPHP